MSKHRAEARSVKLSSRFVKPTFVPHFEVPCLFKLGLFWGVSVPPFFLSFVISVSDLTVQFYGRDLVPNPDVVYMTYVYMSVYQCGLCIKSFCIQVFTAHWTSFNYCLASASLLLCINVITFKQAFGNHGLLAGYDA